MNGDGLACSSPSSLSFLFLLIEKDMYEDPAKTMNKVTDFLGLCQWEWDDVTSKIHNRKEKRYPNSPLPLSSFSLPCPPSCIIKMIL